MPRVPLLLAGLGVVLLCAAAAPGRAQSSPPVGRAFSDVPASDPIYPLMRRLEGRVFTGYPVGTFSGKRTLVRFEFAVALQRVLGELQRADVPAGNPATDTGEIRLTGLSAMGSPALFRCLRDVRAAVQEFKPEFAILGTDWDAQNAMLTRLVERASTLPPSPGPPAPGDPDRPKTFDAARLELLGQGDAVARARTGARLLREEVEEPSEPQITHGFIQTVTAHPDFLVRIIERLAAEKPAAAVLKQELRATAPGELRQCLTVTLGMLGDHAVLPDLEALASDAGVEIPLRKAAIRALGAVRDPGAVAALNRLLQDRSWVRGWYSQGGCIVSGPRMREYLFRQTARDALERLRRAGGADTARIDDLLEAAVLREPLRDTDG